eukprot:3633051-Rhodomonas_salina.1
MLGDTPPGVHMSGHVHTEHTHAIACVIHKFRICHKCMHHDGRVDQGWRHLLHAADSFALDDVRPGGPDQQLRGQPGAGPAP